MARMGQLLPKDFTIPRGSWIVVTGVNGYIASNIADQLLHHGYNVRGTVRALSKGEWMKALFETKYKDCIFELAQVEDVTRPGAFEQALQGASGVVHVATVFGGGADMIQRVIDMNKNLLVTASQEPKMKRFVCTSSSEAAVYSSFLEQDASQPIRVTANTWNEKGVERVSQEPSFPTPKAGFDLYAASKTLGEQAIWQWVKEHQPGFVVNTVLPSVCFGRSVDPKNQGHASSSAWPAAIFQNKFDNVWPFLKHVITAGAYFVDVDDLSILHMAGLLHPDVQNERLFAFGSPFTWSQVISLFQKLFPDREFPDEPPTQTNKTGNLDIEPSDRAEELLRSFGKPGWSGLEATLRANIEDLI